MKVFALQVLLLSSEDGDSLTPHVVKDALAKHVGFSGDAGGPGAGGRPVAPGGAPALVERTPDQGSDPAQGLKKGMSGSRWRLCMARLRSRMIIRRMG